MKKLRIVLFLLAICMLAFIAENTNAQTFPIRIKLHQPVPGQLNASNLWKATLTNTSRNDMKISLEGYAEEQRDGRIVEGQTAVFKISPGDREYKYEDFKNGSVKWSNKKYETVLLRTGNAPAGTYTICMTAKDEEGNIVGMEQCIMQVIGGDVQQEITLLSPEDGSAGEGDEMGFTFSWLSPNAKGPYSLRIIEIRGEQSPDAAMNTNVAFFEQKRIIATTFQYPVTAPKFEIEKNYAWQISAGDVKSEVWTIRPRPGQKPSCKDFKVSIVLNNKGDEKRKISPGTREGDTALNKGDEKRKISPGTREGDTALNKGDEKRKISPGNRDGDLITGKEDNGSACFYNISITNNYNGSAANGPASFRITTINSNIISAAGVPTGWNQTPASVPPNTNYIVWSKAQGTIQTGSINLGTVTFGNGAADPFYVVYEWMEIKGKVICRDSVQVGVCGDDCKNNLIRNGGFIQANVQGVMPSPGAVQFWTRGYGSPTVDNNPSEGFIEQGFIKLSGNLISGQSVAQVLDPNNKIVTGKKYKLSVAVRFMSSQNSLDYVKIRVIAFNGNIFSAGGIHPPPSTDVAIIGRSSKIRDCNDWSVIEFPVWTANKDFSNIAINAFTNDNSNATVWIDNVTSCEVTQSDCAEIQVDAAGNPILPSGYGNLPQGITCQPEAEGDDYYNGSLQDLYPGYNGTSDIYSQGKIPCSSIGGTLPPEVNNYNCDDSLRAAGINMTCDELQTLLNQPFDPPQSPYEQAPLPPIPSLRNNICDKPGPQKMETMPFHGRDIIYIHGLQMDHIVDRAAGIQGATGYWPANASEYYTGYYYNVAVNNMLPHIDHFIRGRGNKNRFIIVCYDCSESAEVAVHSVLSQIREAMENGTGVQFDSSDQRKRNCFGRDYVFISHSTGALVSDVALSIANKTKTDINLKAQYGDIGLISDRCKGRVSIQGAYSGSSLAKIACTVAQNYPTLFGIAVTAMSFAPLSPQTITSIASAPQIIANSVLVDLIPSLSRSRWSSYINDINVPVFTIAGGHPSAILGPLKYSIHPGFDDGVLTMDCANGNNNPLSNGHSRFSATSSKVFDMGIPLIRGIEYYLDQKVSDGVFAAASTAYLSPTGMVEPVSSIIVDPQIHSNNHFSFIQSSKEHWFNSTEPGSGNIPCDYHRTSPGGYTNNEEELVVNNPSLFTPGLIDPSIISQMGETLKDMHIDLPWLKIVYRRGLPRLTIYWKRFYIWKRTYHKLNDNCMYDVDYAYKYLFKQ